MHDVRMNTNDELVDKKVKTLKYGPYENVKPFSYDFLRIHFRMPFPIPHFT